MNAIVTSQCTKCGEHLGPECFNMRKDRGVPYRQCRGCMGQRRWAKNNPERHQALARKWVENNLEQARMLWRRARAKKFERNPALRIHGRLSCQVWSVLKGRKNCQSVFKIVGYSFSDLKTHIERQFTKGMSWENMGKWHIDHIVPLSSFEINSVDDPSVKAAWALSNLRPLWAAENMKKRANREFLL